MSHRDDALTDAKLGSNLGSRLGKGLLLFCGALFAIGLVARVAPLFDVDDRLMRQHPTEDGYFMLTIARNFAIGNGFAVTGGEMPTNGTQPLTTFLWSIAFFLVGGARKAGVGLVQVFELFAAIAAAFGVYLLGRRTLLLRPEGKSIALLAAAVWFASPLVVPHSMNCLESGVYAMIGVYVAAVFVEPPEKDAMPWSWGRSVLVGVLLGLTFWTRNDACFLILGACLAYLFAGYHCGPLVTRVRFSRVLVFGATSVVVASPWLIHNLVSFGHIMPVSGRAESLTGTFAGNLPSVPPVLAEYFTAVLPIPQTLQERGVVVALCTVFVLAAALLLVFVWRRAALPERTLLVLTGVYGLSLCLFYGLFFGAGWFIARYMFPLSTFITLLWASVVWTVWRRLSPTIQKVGGALFAVGILALVSGLHLRTYRNGSEHAHFQVVAWVEQNVADETYVGAVQTGTLGFFHDRTINLDGKVNLGAYHALKEARIAEYVVESPIQVIADWAGVVDWIEMEPMRDNFDVVVHDRDLNLCVLRRKPSRGTLAPPPPPEPTP